LRVCARDHTADVGCQCSIAFIVGKSLLEWKVWLLLRFPQKERNLHNNSRNQPGTRVAWNQII